MPMSTRFFDMRIKGENSCEWLEDFIVNENAKHLLQPNVLLLFEILELNDNLIMEKSPKLNAERFYPVAWAYLRPLGTSCIHTNRTRLQLFKYKFKYDNEVKQHRPLDPRTPEVLLDFNWKRKEKYPSHFEVELSFVNRPDPIDQPIPRTHYSRAPWEAERSLYPFAEID